MMSIAVFFCLIVFVLMFVYYISFLADSYYEDALTRKEFWLFLIPFYFWCIPVVEAYKKLKRK